MNIGNAGNTFTGPININGAEVQFQNDGSFGAVPGRPRLARLSLMAAG